MKIYLYNIIIMENYIIMCLPLIEAFENCTNSFYQNMSNLYNTIINSINDERTYSYTESVNKITRSHSDSKIKYSDINNPDGWEMLQIRLV